MVSSTGASRRRIMSMPYSGEPRDDPASVTPTPRLCQPDVGTCQPPAGSLPITDWIKAAMRSVESLAKACTGEPEGEETTLAIWLTVCCATVRAALRAADWAPWAAEE